MNSTHRMKYPELCQRACDSIGRPLVYVYAIRRADTKEVKIGTSNSPPDRLELLQTAHGAPLELVAYFRGNVGDEGELHKRFTAHRKLGEWFHEAPEITAWIESIQGGDA